MPKEELTREDLLSTLESVCTCAGLRSVNSHSVPQKDMEKPDLFKQMEQNSREVIGLSNRAFWCGC